MALLDTNLFNEQFFESLGKAKWYLVHVDIALLWPQPQQTCLWSDINWMLCVHVQRLSQATRLFHRFWNRSSNNSRIDKNFHEFLHLMQICDILFLCSFMKYIPIFILYWFPFYHIPHLSHVLCKVFDYDVVFSLVLKHAKPRIERDLCSLWGFLRVGTGHCSMNVIESRVSVWCLLYQIFTIRSYNFFFLFAFWTTRYERKDAVDMSTSLTAWMQYAILRFSVKLLEHSCIKCLSHPPLSTVILHWLPRRAVKFPPVPTNSMYSVLPSHFSVLSFRIGSFAEACIFSCSPTLHESYFAPPPVISVIALARSQSRVLSSRSHILYVSCFYPVDEAAVRSSR